MRTQNPATRAFTLIELLIVVAIIAILAAIAVPNFLEAQTRAKVSRAKADMRSQATAIESYSVDYNTYPYGVLPGNVPPYRWQWGFMPGGPNETTPPSAMGGLTSPIAYMTSLPTDGFAIDYVVPGGGTASAAKGSIQSRFRIWTPRFLEGVSAFGTEAALMANHRNLMGALGLAESTPYLITSPGPDGTEDAMPAYNPVMYDPTNGTVSGGDIVWAGGGSFKD